MSRPADNIKFKLDTGETVATKITDFETWDFMPSALPFDIWYCTYTGNLSLFPIVSYMHLSELVLFNDVFQKN